MTEPGLTDAESFLKRWHSRHAGGSAVVFGEARDASGLNSYERVAAAACAQEPIGAGEALDLLDLGCGDGFLLEAIGASAPEASLTGVDMSPDELAAAEKRVPTARWVEARAQVLPFDDGSFDVVTCHMAFMLMDDVDGVLSEVRRVLRPGGRFVGVVGHADREAWVGDVFTALRVVRLGLQIPWGPTLGDERCRSVASLRALVEGAGLEDFAHEIVETWVDVPRSSLAAFICEAYYGMDELPLDAIEGGLAGLDLPDPVRWPFPVLQFVARRP